jgi:hypothetical protein
MGASSIRCTLVAAAHMNLESVWKEFSRAVRARLEVVGPCIVGCSVFSFATAVAEVRRRRSGSSSFALVALRT